MSLEVYICVHRCKQCNGCMSLATPFEVNYISPKTGKPAVRMASVYTTVAMIHASKDETEEYRVGVIIQEGIRNPSDLRPRDRCITNSAEGWQYLCETHPDLYNKTVERVEALSLDVHVAYTPEPEVDTVEVEANAND